MPNAQIYISDLSDVFLEHANDSIAGQQSAYMKNKFSFHGLKTPLRRELQKPFLKNDRLPGKDELHDIIPMLWEKPEREYQYFGIDLFRKYSKRLHQEHMPLMEFMVLNRSWWDTVDLIATNLMGDYFRGYPGDIPHYTTNWMDSGNIWLQRSAILFQLKYKDKVDKELLARIIRHLLGSNEFFINKAIGWALREYSKTNPDWVRGFLRDHELSSLSVREGSKYL